MARRSKVIRRPPPSGGDVPDKSKIQPEGDKTPHESSAPPAPESQKTPVPGHEARREPKFIVGIGASAGGLEPLETFFNGMPADSGTAFVVIQHLSPDFKSLMDELLGRRTSMRILRAENEMRVEADTVYLIPPKKEMAILDGRLMLTDQDRSGSLSLPIDVFFRSLARDQEEKAVGIVLCGTGSDGSRGIQEIRDGGGLTIAQDPKTTRFDGMPRSAISTGSVDWVLPTSEIPPALMGYFADPIEGRVPPGRKALKVPKEGVDAILELLNEHYGIDFSCYKPTTVTRRIERRLMIVHASNLEDYVRRLRDDPEELNTLYKDLLIGVTRFFRDAEGFQVLEREVIPEIMRDRPKNQPVRVWVAGCATGEEAYSLAILLHEQAKAAGYRGEIKIFATDVHRSSLDFAASGLYPESALTGVSSDRLASYFTAEDGYYRVTKELRQLVVFAPHNVSSDAPFTRIDLITCRNMLIYLQPQVQKKVITLFHFSLVVGGALFLGASETVGDLSDEFSPVDRHWRVYRKRRDVRLIGTTPLSMSSGPLGARYSAGAATGQVTDKSLMRAYDALLGDYVPAGFLINEQRELLHTFGGASKYLAPSDGRVQLDLLNLVSAELRTILGAALQRLGREETAVLFNWA